MFLFRSSAEFKVACISDALKNYYRVTFRFENEKIAVIRSGVDLNKYISIEPHDLSIFFKDQTLPVLLHTGSISEERGAQFLADILRENCFVNLLHVGGNPEAVEKLKSKDNTGRLVALPHVDPEKLPAIQMGATALLFPMTSSTPTAWCCSPMKIFEYAAARVNLIATCPGAVSELINSTNAYIVPENDAKAVGKALCDIVSNSAEAASKRSNLYQLARDWDYKKRAAAIMEMFCN
ncbi:glycosyltransferase family 4 protein [Paracoccaceae bacterium]|nr:glycosyltransferase family 4 protein [Paracoccaceae bacterium]